MLARIPTRVASVRTVAVTLLIAAGVAIVALALSVLAVLPAARGTTPWRALGARWTFEDLAVVGGVWGVTGLVLGGWKALAIAVGRPTSRASAVAWLGVFTAFTLWVVIDTVRTIEAFGWPL
jgi:hypothetical protein